jgi:hypothetical protein
MAFSNRTSGKTYAVDFHKVFATEATPSSTNQGDLLVEEDHFPALFAETYPLPADTPLSRRSTPRI